MRKEKDHSLRYTLRERSFHGDGLESRCKRDADVLKLFRSGSYAPNEEGLATSWSIKHERAESTAENKVFENRKYVLRLAYLFSSNEEELFLLFILVFLVFLVVGRRYFTNFFPTRSA